jgi:hypothetical protein
MRNLFLYWAIFLGIHHGAWGQVVGPPTPPMGGTKKSIVNGRKVPITNPQLPITTEDEVRKCLVKTALSQTHVRELTGHNDGTEIRKYLKMLNLPEGTPYCAAFVEWVYRSCGVVSNVQYPARAFNWIRYPHRIVWNKAALPKKTPQLGDVAVFAWRQRRAGNYKIRHHSEIVIEWQDDDEIEDFVTVGGNTTSPTNKKIEGVFRKLRDKDLAVVACHLSPQLSPLTLRGSDPEGGTILKPLF